MGDCGGEHSPTCPATAFAPSGAQLPPGDYEDRVVTRSSVQQTVRIGPAHNESSPPQGKVLTAAREGKQRTDPYVPQNAKSLLRPPANPEQRALSAVRTSSGEQHRHPSNQDPPVRRVTARASERIVTRRRLCARGCRLARVAEPLSRAIAHDLELVLDVLAPAYGWRMVSNKQHGYSALDEIPRMLLTVSAQERRRPHCDDPRPRDAFLAVANSRRQLSVVREGCPMSKAVRCRDVVDVWRLLGWTVGSADAGLPVPGPCAQADHARGSPSSAGKGFRSTIGDHRERACGACRSAVLGGRWLPAPTAHPVVEVPFLWIEASRAWHPLVPEASLCPPILA